MQGKTLVTNAGEVIYSPFSEQQNVFIIRTGYVLAYTNQDDGKRRIHLLYGPGSYFPVLTTFQDTEQRATYETLTRTALIKYGRQEFLSEIANNHEFSNQILSKTVAQLSIFADRIIGLQITGLEDKLIHRLKTLAKVNGIEVKEGIRLPYKLKHHHLSDMLGSERESTSRMLMILKKKGFVAKDTNGFLIINKDL